jgi:hypothetical protein
MNEEGGLESLSYATMHKLEAYVTGSIGFLAMKNTGWKDFLSLCNSSFLSLWFIAKDYPQLFILSGITKRFLRICHLVNDYEFLGVFGSLSKGRKIVLAQHSILHETNKS